MNPTCLWCTSTAVIWKFCYNWEFSVGHLGIIGQCADYYTNDFHLALHLCEECQCLLTEKIHAKLFAEIKPYVMLTCRGQVDLLKCRIREMEVWCMDFELPGLPMLYIVVHLLECFLYNATFYILYNNVLCLGFEGIGMFLVEYPKLNFSIVFYFFSS